MQLSLRKIDDRIKKLQEIRRIAADPELVAMLFEFIATEDERTASAPADKAIFAAGRDAPGPNAPSLDDVSIVNQVVNGMDSQATSLWSRKK